MTVKELRRRLSGYPDDAFVEIWEGAAHQSIYIHKAEEDMGTQRNIGVIYVDTGEEMRGER